MHNQVYSFIIYNIYIFKKNIFYFIEYQRNVFKRQEMEIFFSPFIDNIFLYTLLYCTYIPIMMYAHTINIFDLYNIIYILGILCRNTLIIILVDVIPIYCRDFFKINEKNQILLVNKILLVLTDLLFMNRSVKIYFGMFIYIYSIKFLPLIGFTKRNINNYLHNIYNKKNIFEVSYYIYNIIYIYNLVLLGYDKLTIIGLIIFVYHVIHITVSIRHLLRYNTYLYN
jgi:hypothetical protein